ncbi:Astacin-like metalloendopeptidase [Strongyloides ratti]|uniref:Metalloendopeptidase n=1 Tax=Strongyloides ratti TaxID=34506 RepID=A0A090LJF3_STRRB|nr:Astacin-like metalloendopeptidase [Strongyloides ratti]CEF68238.1 Astacin-like metalloendopeptidase [Strongyloides ratti]
MINLKIFFLYSVIYILCIFFSIINSTNFSSNEEYIKKRNVKRSIEEINNLKYDNEILDNLLTNNRKKRNLKIKVGKHKWTSPINLYFFYPLKNYMVKKATNILEKSTCLRFRYVNNFNHFKEGIQLVASYDCNSPLGKIFEKGWQKIDIGIECNSVGGILQMLLRTLGVIYEHNRVDRNFYVKIFQENVHLTDKKKFRISRTTAIDNFHLPYEYGSLMHFGMYNYSDNKLKTLIVKIPLYENTIGQQEELTFNDIKTLNLYYCSNICKIKIRCKNHGYQNPNNCNRCICIDGFEGDQCEYYKLLRGCGPNSMRITRRPSFLRIFGKKSCFFHLRANKVKKIKITILKMQMKSTYFLTCLPSNSIEIKYWKDKSVTGARFCHQRFPKIIISSNNYVILHYNSNDPTNYVYMYFKDTS